jgi:hypothetical protein
LRRELAALLVVEGRGCHVSTSLTSAAATSTR